MDRPLVMITQHELEDISNLEREVAWRAKKLDEMKSSVKESLMLHVPVEPGRFNAKLRTIPYRNIPWKTLVMERLPLNVMEWFRKLHPVRVRFEVEVIEHATEPLWQGRDDQAIDLN